MKVLFMIVLTLLSVNVPANNISRSARQVIKVGLYENPPKIFTDQQGKAAGFWPEIIENIAKKEGWSIKWVKVTWHDGIKKLQNAEIDIMPDTGWTVARERKFIFSKEVVITSWSRLYIPQNSTVKTIVDLNGKTIAGLKGGSIWKALKALKTW